MRFSKWTALATACSMMVFAGTALAFAEKTVELKGVHLCCGACVKGVGAALKGVEGVKPKCDQQAGTVSLTAESDAAIQKALDALGAAGYYGDTKTAGLAIKAGSAPSGKVKSLSLSGVHNCCGSCCRAIKAAVKKVAGVTGDTATPKGASFDVTGDFEAKAVIEALNAAGFNASAK